MAQLKNYDVERPDGVKFSMRLDERDAKTYRDAKWKLTEAVAAKPKATRAASN